MLLKTSLIPLSCLLLSATASAGEFNADSFIKEKCTGCHDSNVYTRSNRRVDSLARLDSQVRMCDANLGIKMFDEDVKAVVELLNDKYYHFK